MSLLKVVAVVLALVAAVAARPDHGAAPPAYGAPPPPAPPPPPPTSAPPPPIPPPTNAPPPPPPLTHAPPPPLPATYNQPEPQTAKPVYSFDSAVYDDQSGNDFGHKETREGEHTEGSFYLLLPDGRVEKVTYTVDDEAGFVATVQFDGEIRKEETSNETPTLPTYGASPP